MITVHILGTGCPKCQTLVENAEEAVRETGTEARVVKVDDITEILKFGVMTTPGLAIGGDVKSCGRVLSVEEIETLLSEETENV